MRGKQTQGLKYLTKGVLMMYLCSLLMIVLNITIIIRAFNALGVPSASLDLGSFGRIALW